MEIQSVFKNYTVQFENTPDFIQRIPTENTMFAVDRKVYELYGAVFERIDAEYLILIDATEENKVIGTALDICEKMTQIPAKRNARLVSVGGGIVQDITGFAANILYRGIKWTYVPTTLLAACDSCIGGKTSLNYKKYKNLLGTFYPPDDIVICPMFFRTLSERDFESGMGEVFKFNIMAGEEGIRYLEENLQSLLDRDMESVSECISRCLLFKQPFIEMDEFDRKERIKLNFAHTFGHAIETVTGYRIPHGTAVAIGTIMANSISVKRGLIRADKEEKIEDLLFRVIHIDVCLLDFDSENFISAMRKDKKQVDKSLTAVLMTEEKGELKIIHDLKPTEVEYALSYIKMKYTDWRNKGKL